jgi:hypothetical protein
MKAIAASKYGTLPAYKPLNTRMIAKDRKSAAHAFALLLPILHTPDIPERQTSGGV